MIRRLFIAIYPPIDVAYALLDLLPRPRPPMVRLVPPEQIHLTLLFLGDRSDREQESVRESVKRATAGISPFQMRVSSLALLPNAQASRLVAATTDLPTGLAELQRRLSVRLAKRPRTAQRAYTPHLTIARGSGMGSMGLEVGMAECAFEAGVVLLVESVLRPMGAEHRVLERFPLEG